VYQSDQDTIIHFSHGLLKRGVTTTHATLLLPEYDHLGATSVAAATPTHEIEYLDRLTKIESEMSQAMCPQSRLSKSHLASLTPSILS
jgi:hypothetical protein